MDQTRSPLSDRNADLRVASYNIRKGVGLDWQRKPARVAAVIAETGADVIALQEADRRFGSRRRVLPADLLALNGWRVVAPDARGESMGWHGNAILAKADVSVHATGLIELPFLEPRGAVSAVLQRGESRFRVIALHLSLSRHYRRKQIGHVLQHLAEAEPMPSIILGDFNEWRGHAASAGDFGPDHAVHLPGHSFHSSRPTATFDRIVTSGGAVVLALGVNRSELARRASDHLPVWADVGLADQI
jgi:endonuclease/exonuclease/phosphatase family metal-dependent hydrolase